MVVTDGVDIPGVQNADVREVALPKQAHVELAAEVYCGHFHCFARSSTGDLWAWGANGEGQLGISGELGDDVFVSAPSQALGTLVEDLRKETPGDHIESATGGRSHSVFVSTSGRCFVAGRLPSTEPSRNDSGTGPIEEVRRIDLADGTGNQTHGRIISCHAGEAHTLFLTDEGEVWSWLGDSAQFASRAGLGRPAARAVLGLPKVAQIACGWHHTLALTEGHQLYSFGNGCFGQLGLGSCRHCPSPSHVKLPEECGGGAVNVAAGFASSFCVAILGGMYAWGSNEKCQLGLGVSVRGTATPKPVDALSKVRISQLAAGFGHTACITAEGLLYLWGSGSYGQLGFGFDDTKASICLDGGGCPPFSPGPQVVGEPGPSAVGHSRHWMQVWPRRCVRGPFRRQKCFDVRCGAYHTVARAGGKNSEAVDVSTLTCPEVLEPALMVLNDPPMASKSGADGIEGDSLELAGLLEGPKAVLRPSASMISQNTETFRKLSSMYWNLPALKGSAPAIAPKAVRVPVPQDEEWRRALEQTGPRCKLTMMHTCSGVRSPLQLRQAEESKSVKSESSDFLRLPIDGTGGLGPTTWDAVDEAVHRAFCHGTMSAKPDFASLWQEVSRIGVDGFSPELPGGEMRQGLPQAPCRGLARIECLTPRPFYLPLGHRQGGPFLSNTQDDIEPVKAAAKSTCDVAEISAVAASVGEDVSVSAVALGAEAQAEDGCTSVVSGAVGVLDSSAHDDSSVPVAATGAGAEGAMTDEGAITHADAEDLRSSREEDQRGEEPEGRRQKEEREETAEGDRIERDREAEASSSHTGNSSSNGGYPD